MRHLSMVAGFGVAAVLFAYFLGGFQTSGGIEKALVAKEQIVADQKCTAETEFLRGELSAANAKYDGYREMVSERVHELRSTVETMRHDVSRYYGLWANLKNANANLKQENDAFTAPKTYEQVYRLYQDSVSDMPIPGPPPDTGAGAATN